MPYAGLQSHTPCSLLVHALTTLSSRRQQSQQLYQTPSPANLHYPHAPLPLAINTHKPVPIGTTSPLDLLTPQIIHSRNSFTTSCPLIRFLFLFCHQQQPMWSNPGRQWRICIDSISHRVTDHYNEFHINLLIPHQAHSLNQASPWIKIPASNNLIIVQTLQSTSRNTSKSE